MLCPSCGCDPCLEMPRCRYPYTHHGPAVYGSKLADYLISEANMRDDDAEPCCMSAAHGQACACAERDALRAERDRLREALREVQGILGDARRAYHNSEQWRDEGPDGCDGPSFDDLFEAAFARAALGEGYG